MGSKIKEINDIDDNNLKLTIYDVLENFDFDKVHEYMESTNWRWALCKKDENGNYYAAVPSISQLRNTAKELILDTINYANKNDNFDGPYMSATGGLKATYYPKIKKDGTYNISLEFILTDYICEYY